MAADPPRFLQESMELGILPESGQGKQDAFLEAWWRQVGPGSQQSSNLLPDRELGLWRDQLPAEVGEERDKVEKASPFSSSSRKSFPVEILL